MRDYTGVEDARAKETARYQLVLNSDPLHGTLGK